MISFFKAPIQNTNPAGELSLGDLHRFLVGFRYKEITEHLRSLPDNAKNSFKVAELDFVVAGGTFSKRKASDLLKPSDLIVLDLDNIDVSEARSKLLNDTILPGRLLFTSPSGNGIKYIIEVVDYPHKLSFRGASNYLNRIYGLQVDPSGGDICRACFICHDPDAVLMHKTGMFNPEQWIPKDKFKGYVQRSTTWSTDVEKALQNLENRRLDITSRRNNWIKLGLAFASEFGESGREYFHRVSRFHVDYAPAETDRVYSELLRNNRGEVTINTFFHLAKTG